MRRPNTVIGAVDVGGTKIAAAAVMTDGRILARCERPTNAEEGFETAEQRIVEMLRGVLPAGMRFAGIGLACPGPLDHATGVLGVVGTLPSWSGKSFVPALEREFAVSVAVENDADAAALAEAHWGAVAAQQSFLYITISTGIGGGFLVSGHLYRGSGGAHPEFGHQILENNGPLCYCGSRGCWESLASGAALTQWMQEQRSDAAVLSAEEICRMALGGDDLACRAMKRESYYLGLGLANLVTLFAPEVIALGGGVMKSSALFLYGALEHVRQRCTQVPVENTRIVPASLGADVGLLGAARAWMLREQQLGR